MNTQSASDANAAKRARYLHDARIITEYKLNYVILSFKREYAGTGVSSSE